MPELKLWYAPGACSLATHIALRETGLPFDLIKASTNEAREPMKIPEEFRKVNPKRRVPVLGYDDEIITEAPAILFTISSLAPQLHLYGSTTLEQIRVVEWLNWASGTLHAQAYGAVLRPERFTDDVEIHEKIREQGKITVEKCYQEIEQQLLSGQFAVGNSFTVVDAYLFPFWGWGKRGGMAMEEMYPKYTDLVTRVRQRESTNAALEAEGLSTRIYGFSETTSRV